MAPSHLFLDPSPGALENYNKKRENAGLNSREIGTGVSVGHERHAKEKYLVLEEKPPAHMNNFSADE